MKNPPCNICADVQNTVLFAKSIFGLVRPSFPEMLFHQLHESFCLGLVVGVMMILMIGSPLIILIGSMFGD